MNNSTIIFDQEVSFYESMDYFTDMPEVTPIPNESIIYKTITGIGATHSEIVSKRHSIIVLPHISIVTSKQESYAAKGIKTFAIHGDITPKMIYEHLKTCDDYAKLLTTPQGLNKIIWLLKQDVLYKVKMDCRKIFFLLIDECHKVSKDANYRKEMMQLMDHFFEFDQKAMVSATPLQFSDPRFIEQDFKKIKIKPEFEYKHDIELTQTSSLINGLQTYFSENQHEHHFIFLNSVSGIKSIINQLSITDNYRIFCSKESTDKLHIQKEMNATSSLGGFKKYNFFTSSFFNGLDIIVDYKPNILILTDCGIGNHTLLDPYTDILQIVGRFRKRFKKDIPYNKITHINNAKRFTSSNTTEEAVLTIAESKAHYLQLQSLMELPCNKEIYTYLKQALSTVKPYSALIDANGKESSFLYDNYFHKQSIKGYYKSESTLKTAYYVSQLYNVTNKREIYAKEEIINIQRQSITYKPAINKLMAEALCDIEDYQMLEVYYEQRAIVEKLSYLIFEGYVRLGFEELKAVKFSKRKIKEALLKLNIKEGKNSFPIINLMHIKFKLRTYYTHADIKKKLQQIFDEFGICYKAKATDVEHYFEFESCKRNGSRVYLFKDYKQFTAKEVIHI
jgi:hypothetical protein